MDIQVLSGIFRYDGRLGRLYRGRKLVEGTPKSEDGPLVVTINGKQFLYARVCFALAHGYWPKQARHRNGRVRDNRKANLYDPSAESAAGNAHAHAGKYPGVHIVNCQRTGRFRGYRGSAYIGGRRFYTAVVETPEMARDLRKTLVPYEN